MLGMPERPFRFGKPCSSLNQVAYNKGIHLIRGMIFLQSSPGCPWTYEPPPRTGRAAGRSIRRQERVNCSPSAAALSDPRNAMRTPRPASYDPPIAEQLTRRPQAGSGRNGTVRPACRLAAASSPLQNSRPCLQSCRVISRSWLPKKIAQLLKLTSCLNFPLSSSGGIRKKKTILILWCAFR